MAVRPRSILFVPAANAKALAKAPKLDADAIIIDLEDAVAPGEKEAARAATLRALGVAGWKTPIRAVRINPLQSPWGQGDVLAIAPSAPDVLVIPKVESADMLRQIRVQISRAALPRGWQAPILWAMVETPRGILNIKEIAASAAETGLGALIAGTNDLAKALRCDGLAQGRLALQAHLSTLVLVARCYDLMVFDGVYNAFADEAAFAREAKQGRAFGFDGKTLIHPAQIGPARTIFGPDGEAIKQAKAIVRAFGLKKNAGKGVINLGGQMIERLHLQEARSLLDSLPVLSAKPSSSARSSKRKS
ncbi:MAG: CoA ester lyase [Robiginitomaculum sp.]|nr:MAG: CoA ester lyase [Robiginitomaculum sp.]